MKVNADCAMGSNTTAAGEGINDGSDDGVADHVSIPVPPKNLPFRLPLETHAESLRLHFWDCLVGNRPQLNCLFCRLPCKASIPFT